MRYLTALVVILWVCASSAEVMGQRTEWGYDENGNYTPVTETQFLPGGAFAGTDYLPPPSDDGLLWHYNTPEHWIKTAEIGDHSQYLFAGSRTGQEDFLGLSMFSMGGDGEPLWQYFEKIGSYNVCSARNADIFYGGFTNSRPFDDTGLDLRRPRRRLLPLRVPGLVQ
jgi:hypothetical protein